MADLDGWRPEPRWRRDGKELFYRAADDTLMAVAVSTQSTFEHGNPYVLFPVRMSDWTWNDDVTPDGQRFVISLAIGDPLPPPIHIVLNGTEAVQR